MKKNTDLLNRAAANWLALESFRRERERCKRYTYGSQWNDPILVDGAYIKEEDYIRQQGNIPLKNNLIRRIVRNVIGVFRSQYVAPDNSPTEKLNEMEELYSRTMEEFLISGLAVHRKWFGRRDGFSGCLTDYVQPDFFFIDSGMRDFRGRDASIVGELHDVGFDELACRLAYSPERLRELRAVYSEAASDDALDSFRHSFGQDIPAVDFLRPSSPDRCRVIEVWQRSPVAVSVVHDPLKGTLAKMPADRAERFISSENRKRLDLDPGIPLLKGKWLLEEHWRFFFLSPFGDVLAEGESPYPHGGHPYIFKAYPFIDGEIHSFVCDLIDQQRYINRLVTLFDWIMRASAKGVLLFPEEALPDDLDINDISSEWSRFNGVILFKPKPGVPIPQQISGNAANIGITELLDIQLRMMEDVSGVNSALQGKLDSGAVSGTLYNQQTRHALTGLLDILRSFNSFIDDARQRESLLLGHFKKNPSNHIAYAK